MFIFGGRNDVISFDDLHRFAFGTLFKDSFSNSAEASNSWSKIECYGVPPSYPVHSAMVVKRDGTLLVYGGQDINGECTSELHSGFSLRDLFRPIDLV